ncbi:MAG: hypothetical protein ACXVIP_04630 [Halobacteriota archaeon]
MLRKRMLAVALFNASYDILRLEEGATRPRDLKNVEGGTHVCGVANVVEQLALIKSGQRLSDDNIIIHHRLG